MTTRFPRSESTIETCQRHLSGLHANSPPIQVDPQIEAVLAAYICSVIYGEAEARVVDIIASRLHRESHDSYVESYAKVASRRLVRSIKISELSGLASHFSEDCKTRFKNFVAPQDQMGWDAIMNNRHAVAHDSRSGQVFNLTMSDTVGYFECVGRVMNAFETCLEVPASDNEQTH